MITASIRESRRISQELMPLHVEHFGLVESIRQLCKAYHTEKLNLSCSVMGFKNPVDKYLQLTVYRMVQELVINVVRHSGATIAQVKLSHGKESIKLTVQDNGHNLDALKAVQQGFGLKLIKNKVELLKRTFELTAEPGKGTKVFIVIPI